MSQDQFRKVEDEFFRLKGQLAAGRITSAQFENALKELVFQDAQSRYWMIGADTGKWYVHDGKNWVEAMPTPNPTIAAELKRAQEELARLKAEKTRLYPPNPHPLAQPDHYPTDYTQAQIQQRNEIVSKIEALEQQIERLQDQLYKK